MIRQEVEIADCVHFRGFRYGGFGENIYEDYICGLASNADLSLLRRQLIDRVLALKGGGFSDTLGIPLEKNYPSWIYPWSFRSMFKRAPIYWSPESNPDILCHYSEGGVLASHINREFFWLERAYGAISKGYKPEEFGYIKVMKMNMRGVIRYLVLDGNHRISSMHAMGYKKVYVEISSSPACSLSVAPFWPGVVSGVFTLRDARSIFERYFSLDNFVLQTIPWQKVVFDVPLLD